MEKWVPSSSEDNDVTSVDDFWVISDVMIHFYVKITARVYIVFLNTQEVLNQCRDNVGPASATLDQRYPDISSAPRVCWEVACVVGNSPVILSLYLKIIATEGFSLQNVLSVSLE